jgi:hypothetical protein
MDRKITIRKTTLSDSSDRGYVPGTMESRLEMAWQLSQEVWSLLPNQNVEPRLQRDVAVLIRREG